MDNATLAEYLQTILTSPGRIDLDGLSITERPLQDQIALLRFLRSVEAQQNQRRGIPVLRVLDPGSPGGYSATR
jgi:hypothetical protein